MGSETQDVGWVQSLWMTGFSWLIVDAASEYFCRLVVVNLALFVLWLLISCNTNVLSYRSSHIIQTCMVGFTMAELKHHTFPLASPAPRTLFWCIRSTYDCLVSVWGRLDLNPTWSGSGNDWGLKSGLLAESAMCYQPYSPDHDTCCRWSPFGVIWSRHRKIYVVGTLKPCTS